MESVGAIRSSLLAASLCGCIVAQTQAASASSEVWVAVRADAVAGTGSPDNPYDGSTQAKFDAVMAAIPANTTIHLRAGMFVTRGIVPKSGWRLYLAERTTLRLDLIAAIPGQKWSIFGGGSHGSFSDISIEGGIWDCNLQNQTIPLAAQAISFIGGGGNVTIKNIKAINWGSTLPGAECFVVSVFNVGSTGTIAKDIIFDGIEVTQPAAITHRSSSSLIGANGQDPSNVKELSNGWIQKVEIKNCYVHDLDLPVMTASVQMGAWCQGVQIHDNRFENLGPKNNTLFGCYLDTGASENVLVEKNVFSGVVHSIYANLTAPVRNWTIRNNRILINRNYTSGGIELRSSDTKIRDILIERNVISSVDGKSLTTNGIVLGKVSGGILRHNIIDDINGSAHIRFEAGVTGIELFDNRKRNGAVIRPTSVRP